MEMKKRGRPYKSITECKHPDKKALREEFKIDNIRLSNETIKYYRIANRLKKFLINNDNKAVYINELRELLSSILETPSLSSLSDFSLPECATSSD